VGPGQNRPDRIGPQGKGQLSSDAEHLDNVFLGGRLRSKRSESKGRVCLPWLNKTPQNCRGEPIRARLVLDQQWATLFLAKKTPGLKVQPRGFGLRKT
jgi:hypothetical protein